MRSEKTQNCKEPSKIIKHADGVGKIDEVLKSSKVKELIKTGILPDTISFADEETYADNIKLWFTPMPHYLLNHLIGIAPIENFLDRETIWECIRWGVSNANRYFYDKIDGHIVNLLSRGFLVTLFATESGKKFIESLVNQYNKLTHNQKLDPTFKARIDGKIKEFPSGVVTSSKFSNDVCKSIFFTNEKAFKNLIEEGKKLNPYILDISEVFMLVSPILNKYKNIKLSDLYRSYMYIIFKRVENYLKLIESSLNKEDIKSRYLKNVFKIWMDPEIWVGDTGSRKKSCVKAVGFSRHIGTMLNALEKRGLDIPTELKESYKEIKKYYIPKMFEEDTGKEMKKLKDIKKLLIYRSVIKAGEGPSAYVNMAIAMFLAFPLARIITAIDPNLTYAIGNFMVQLGFGSNPNFSGSIGLGAICAGIVYESLELLYRGIKVMLDEKISVYNIWLKNYVPKQMEKREKEYIKLIIKVTKSLLPYSKIRVENIYTSIKKAEDEEYIPKTIKEIEKYCEDVDNLLSNSR